MLSSAIQFLEKYPARIIQVNLLKNKVIEQYVYTILAKTEKGVETFQLQGNILFHMSFAGKEIDQKEIFRINPQRLSKREAMENAIKRQ